MKKRIQEVCGFNNLKRDEKIKRAHEILNNTELKQSICNQILGASFKDVERAVSAIIDERRLTREQEEMLELEAQAPEKFDKDDLEFQFKVAKTSAPKSSMYMDPSSYEYRAHIEELLAEYFGRKEEDKVEAVQSSRPADYPTLSLEETQELLAEYYGRKDSKKSSK